MFLEVIFLNAELKSIGDTLLIFFSDLSLLISKLYNLLFHKKIPLCRQKTEQSAGLYIHLNVTTPCNEV